MRIEIEAPHVRFYSQRDEASFFERLNQLPAVGEIYGQGRVIYIPVCEDELDDDQVMDLIATFVRYDVGLRNLARISADRFPWLMRPDGFWFEEMFGSAG